MAHAIKQQHPEVRLFSRTLNMPLEYDFMASIAL